MRIGNFDSDKFISSASCGENTEFPGFYTRFEHAKLIVHQTVILVTQIAQPMNGHFEVSEAG